MFVISSHNHARSEPKKLLKACKVASRFTAAMEVVIGVPFGQTSTQFCELPQPCNPPFSINRSSRSVFCISPVGCTFFKRTCGKTKGPKKSRSEEHTSELQS